MMDFNGGSKVWSECFADYPLRLVCINELDDCSRFQTSLKELFMVLQRRKDKKGMEALLQENENYRHLDEETMEAIAVMLNNGKILEHRDKFIDEEGNYNMCRALQEMKEESRQEGLELGREEGREEEQMRYSRLILFLSQRGEAELIVKAASDISVLHDLYLRYNM